MSCCCPDCPCPKANQTGSGWRKGNCSTGVGGQSEPCCMCDPDIKPTTPHLDTFSPWDESLQTNLIPCGAVCDPEQAGQEGEWEYTYGTTDGVEDKGKITGRSWTGSCPPGKPDSPECDCQCNIKVNNTCEGDEIPDPDPEVCGCICGLTEDDCPPNLPSVDDENCECVCDVADCAAGEVFNSDICECECPYDTGEAECTSPTPHRDPDACGCICLPPIDCGPACNGLTFDSSICSCAPCASVRPPCPEGEQMDDCCNCVKGCKKGQTEFETAEGDLICCDPGFSECGGACVDTNCKRSQDFDWSACSCVCREPYTATCDGMCRLPCPEGESFNDDCDCAPDYSSSASLLKHLYLLP